MNIRDEAKQKLSEAYALMKQAGIAERFIDLAEQEVEWKDLIDSPTDECLAQVLTCSVCGSDHRVDLTISKTKSHSWQYVLEMEMVNLFYDWGLWDRIKYGCKSFCDIVFRKKTKSDTMNLKGEDLTKLKDILKKIP